jgi:dephospho-CoA kinase
VGLTGGLASGKSSVAVMLARRGAEVLDADALVHELYRPGCEGARTVAELFGAALLAADGSVDRPALGRLVLTDRLKLERLNQAIHPLVRARVAGWLDELGERPRLPEVAIVEAALLVETGSYDDYDLLVVVWCHGQQQLERAVARGVPEERARALLAAQLALDRKRAVADVVVDNSGSREQLVAEVDRAWAEIRARCGEVQG